MKFHDAESIDAAKELMQMYDEKKCETKQILKGYMKTPSHIEKSMKEVVEVLQMSELKPTNSQWAAVLVIAKIF